MEHGPPDAARILGRQDGSMSETIPAHGGQLVDRTVGGEERQAVRQRAASLPAIRLNARSLSDLELLGSGGYSPLRGFMGRADYDSVVGSMRLASGLPWPFPITLAAGRRVADANRGMLTLLRSLLYFHPAEGQA